jgi:selenide, water dikinase
MIKSILQITINILFTLTLGSIAFANVVSDIYACGVTEIDEVKIILSLPEELSENDQQVVSSEIIEGFKSSAKIAGCRLSIQNININPWCIIGGVATSICQRDDIVFPNQANFGDLIILTKPLGTQLATNAMIWREEQSENWLKINNDISNEQIDEIYTKAVESMTTLNLQSARLMRKYHAHATTDVTGFGLVGHAQNLLQFQQPNIDFVITKFPIFQHVKKIAKILNRTSRLDSGTMVETSGGLFIVLSESNAHQFCDEFLATTNKECWIIGRVDKGDGNVKLENPQIIEV